MSELKDFIWIFVACCDKRFQYIDMGLHLFSLEHWPPKGLTCIDEDLSQREPPYTSNLKHVFVDTFSNYLVQFCWRYAKRASHGRLVLSELIQSLRLLGSPLYGKLWVRHLVELHGN